VVPSQYTATIIDTVSQAEPEFKGWANEIFKQQLKLRELAKDRKE
jgi:hypothetical protein